MHSSSDVREAVSGTGITLHYIDKTYGDHNWLVALYCSYQAAVGVVIALHYIDRTYGDNHWLVTLYSSSYCSGGIGCVILTEYMEITGWLHCSYPATLLDITLHDVDRTFEEYLLVAM